MIINNTRDHDIKIRNVIMGKKRVSYIFKSGHPEENTINQYDYDCLMDDHIFASMLRSKVLKIYKPRSTEVKKTKDKKSEGIEVKDSSIGE